MGTKKYVYQGLCSHLIAIATETFLVSQNPPEMSHLDPLNIKSCYALKSVCENPSAIDFSFTY